MNKRIQNTQQTLRSLSPEWFGLTEWDCDCMYDHIVLSERGDK